MSRTMSQESTLIASDIEAYLSQHEHKGLLRFLTCGNVDDGKSTLIGRLLHDSKLIFEDHMAAIKKDSKKFNTTNQEFDLALLVDGLQSEREQGITIDVAYRYFSTEKRKFIIADCPGHEQYTRNMATGASNCDLAIVMIDARKGVQDQTKRHTYIASLLGIRHFIVAVNKMDLVDYDQHTFNTIQQDVLKFTKELSIPDIHFVPMSALVGDNIVNKTTAMPWYHGTTLMSLLETINIEAIQTDKPFRFPVQYVNRPNLDFRGYCGTIVSGAISPDSRVVVLPSKKQSTIKSIVTYDGDLSLASEGQAVTLTLADEIDVSRGDIIVCENDNPPTITSHFTATLVWMNDAPLLLNKAYEFKIGTQVVTGRVTKINYRVDVHTFEQQATSNLQLNEIGSCHIDVDVPVVIDRYDDIQGMGNLILIDKMTNETIAAGMVICTDDISLTTFKRTYTASEVALNEYIRQHYPEWEAKAIK